MKKNNQNGNRGRLKEIICSRHNPYDPKDRLSIIEIVIINVSDAIEKRKNGK